MFEVPPHGGGCDHCIEELGIDAEVEKVQDTVEMRERGVQSQPALFIDGKLKVAGRVSCVEEIKRMLTDEGEEG